MNFNITPGAAAKPLPTAAEKALEKTAPSPTLLSEKVISEVFRTTGPTKKDFPAEIGQPVVVVLDRFFDWMAFNATFPTPFELCTPEQKAELLAIQAETEALVKEMEPYSLTNVSNRLFEIRDAHHKAPSTTLIPKREDVFHDSLQRMQGYEKRLVTLTHERTVPACKPILEQVNKTTCQFLRDQEKTEREACAIQGIEYQPSIQWRCAASVLISGHVRLPKAHMWSDPRTILRGIIEL